ncbi:MAG TPA: GNAT family N-acetyltransferase [Clostridiaceae bacterium]|nr:GNAT family N-acetyltransferase [Clostridiaceae bacterium]
MDIKMVDSQDEKKAVCKSILCSLPDWFGIPEAIDEYVKKSSQMPFWALYDGNNAIGFIAVKKTSDTAAEIYVMGILEAYHRKGYGRRLFSLCYEWCKDNGLSFLQVKTLDKSHPDMHYENARKFYQAMGFKELECIPEIWGKECPCLIMIMSIR